LRRPEFSTRKFGTWKEKEKEEEEEKKKKMMMMMMSLKHPCEIESHSIK
jgi:hypothetical protein